MQPSRAIGQMTGHAPSGKMAKSWSRWQEGRERTQDGMDQGTLTEWKNGKAGGGPTWEEGSDAQGINLNGKMPGIQGRIPRSRPPRCHLQGDRPSSLKERREAKMDGCQRVGERHNGRLPRTHPASAWPNHHLGVRERSELPTRWATIQEWNGQNGVTEMGTPNALNGITEMQPRWQEGRERTQDGMDPRTEAGKLSRISRHQLGKDQGPDAT